MQQRVFVSLVATVLGTLACSDDVGPHERALDGPWSTPLTVSGLALAIDLDWTRDRVSGSGAFSATDPGTRCGPATIRGNGALTLVATRSAPSEIHGQMTFGTGPSFAYQGTLIDTLETSGFARIKGSLIAADGSECPLTMLQGLIP
jgi:hypothetical protein